MHTMTIVVNNEMQEQYKNSEHDIMLEVLRHGSWGNFFTNFVPIYKT